MLAGQHCAKVLEAAGTPDRSHSALKVILQASGTAREKMQQGFTLANPDYTEREEGHSAFFQEMDLGFGPSHTLLSPLPCGKWGRGQAQRVRGVLDLPAPRQQPQECTWPHTSQCWACPVLPFPLQASHSPAFLRCFLNV